MYSYSDGCSQVGWGAVSLWLEADTLEAIGILPLRGCTLHPAEGAIR